MRKHEGWRGSCRRARRGLTAGETLEPRLALSAPSFNVWDMAPADSESLGNGAVLETVLAAKSSEPRSALAQNAPMRSPITDENEPFQNDSSFTRLDNVFTVQGRLFADLLVDDDYQPRHPRFTTDGTPAGTRLLRDGEPAFGLWQSTDAAWMQTGRTTVDVLDPLSLQVRVSHTWQGAAAWLTDVGQMGTGRLMEVDRRPMPDEYWWLDGTSELRRQLPVDEIAPGTELKTIATHDNAAFLFYDDGFTWYVYRAVMEESFSWELLGSEQYSTFSFGAEPRFTISDSPDLLVWSVRTHETHQSIWASNGTEAGTVRMGELSDINREPAELIIDGSLTLVVLPRGIQDVPRQVWLADYEQRSWVRLDDRWTPLASDSDASLQIWHFGLIGGNIILLDQYGQSWAVDNTTGELTQLNQETNSLGYPMENRLQLIHRGVTADGSKSRLFWVVQNVDVTGERVTTRVWTTGGTLRSTRMLAEYAADNGWPTLQDLRPAAAAGVTTIIGARYIFVGFLFFSRGLPHPTVGQLE